MKPFSHKLSHCKYLIAIVLSIVSALCFSTTAYADEQVYYDGVSDQFKVTVTWNVENSHDDIGNYIGVYYYMPGHCAYYNSGYAYAEYINSVANEEGTRSHTFYLQGPPSGITIAVYGSAMDHTQYYIQKVEVEPIKQRNIEGLPKTFTLWEGKFGCSVATMFTNTIACDLYFEDGRPQFSNWYDPYSYNDAIFGDNKFGDTYNYFKPGCEEPWPVYVDEVGVDCDAYGVAWPEYPPSYFEATDNIQTLEVTQESTVYGSTLADPAYEIHDGAEVTTSYRGRTYAGAEYDATEKPTEAGDYAFIVKEVTSDTTYVGGARFAIRKAEPAVTAPTAKTLTFTGQEQQLVEPGQVTGGTMLYALGTETDAPETGWSEEVPTGVNAQTYYVWYFVQGDANHANTEPACVPVTITEPVKATYTCTSGAASTWTKGSKDGLSITFKRSDGGTEDTTFSHFESVAIDGKALTKDTDYTATKGSVVITAQPSYLENLSTGKHTLSANFDDGTGTTDFTVAETVTLTFDANGGTGTMDPMVVTIGDTVTLTKNAFKRDGYTFAGWNLAKDGSGTSYTDGQTVTADSTGTLYAQWDKASATSATARTTANTKLTKANTKLPKTGDPNPVAAVVTMALAGAAMILAGLHYLNPAIDIPQEQR